MIPYEIAKQLKDAGFPIKEELDGFQGATLLVHPTLEEAIEACGFNFGYLLKGITDWTVLGYLNEDVFERKNPQHFIGLSSIEAVLNLWLALNPKNTDVV